MKHTASMLLAAGLAAAQSTTVQILMPMADPQAIAGSVISAGPTATEYFVACATGTDLEECGLGDGGVTVTYGPSTVAYTMAYTAEETYSANVACKLDPSKDEAQCVGTMVEGKTTTVTSDILTGYSTYILPVTITAGADKLAGGTGPTTADSTAAPTATAATTLSTSAVPTNSQGSSSSSASAGAASSTSTSTSTGGVPRITQNAVVLGAAALVGGAMFM
ncbi:hypothetical protein C8A03DRAFT_17953 [Achaetomium macrosporum]|uniref:Uncharacterized protein n=1 Tax=Achaetomium macrosporum TaxID=79813 RepID=A0AAN7C5T8_9PEZI|nr:hypothetical protein C8A03DRAFT_17953 [Achaetomium macrosporum]